MRENLTEVKAGEVYTGYDSIAAIHVCTPSFLGAKACISASVDSGNIILDISLETPFGTVSKTFQISGNISFEWQPFGKFKLKFSVDNFSEQGKNFEFDATIQMCIDVPFLGWKCFSYSHHFTVPIMLPAESDLDDNQFASLLSLNASATAATADPKAAFLQGDIYGDYLKQQQVAFPTVPILSCVYCPTNIPVVCSAGHSSVASNSSASQAISGRGQGQATVFPTIPVFSCVVCATHIPPVCLTGTGAGSLQTAQGGRDGQSTMFPTVPVISCVACVTNIPIVCQANTASGQGLQATGAGQAAFPTLPVSSCVVCVTHIPPLCFTGASTHGSGVTVAGNQAQTVGFPTIPVLTCISCTGIPPIC